VHLACESLRRQECSMVLAGGVNLILAPEASIAFAQAGMLSTSGTCSPFLSAADGFVRGEGCGIVVLKRLADAESAGDRILAVILGSAVNQDGASSGLTAPNGRAQQALLREAHRRAGIGPGDVVYVEAHGTGTKLGDPVESEALGAVFSGRNEKLPIGSVKSNIGHLESAAGVAGLIKLILSLEHGEIPEQIQSGRTSEYIRWEDLALELPTEARTWLPIRGRRIGGVSSFGFSGTNAHVVVEELPHEGKSCVVPESLDVLTISTHTEAALRRLVTRYSTYLRETNWGWNEICQTAGAGRAALAERLAVVAKSRVGAAEKLSDWLDGKAVSGIYRGHVRVTRSGEAEQTDGLPPEGVAELFVQDRCIDWKQRGAGKGLRRAALPTYPFERERYWFEERSDEREVQTIPPGPARLTAQLEGLRLLANVSAEERLGMIRNFLRDEVATVLNLNATVELNEESPLTELGMDSLMALELKHRLQQSSGAVLPANFLFEYSTIQQAATYLNAIVESGQRDADSQTYTADNEGIVL
jgi:acyl transferase domain-containing protein/aryl carrier-like protein